MDTTTFLQAQIQQRVMQGLKLVLLTPDGATTMYPKNAATKAAWTTAALKKGYTILEA
jgi:hypothetical protein